MASLALGLAGQALGGALFAGGLSVFGQTLTGAAIGGLIGGTAGKYIDNLVLGALAPTVRNEGPRMSETKVMHSSEGAAVGRAFGIFRVDGNLIWTTRFTETRVAKTERVGGKGGGQKVENASNVYTVSFAVALGEGHDRVQLGRVWLDGSEVDLTDRLYEFYSGSETQQPDSLIQSIEGIENTPAFRGTAYIVFEDFDLTNYANRLPQVTAELIAPLQTPEASDLSEVARSFVIGPGTGEFVLDSQLATQENSSDSLQAAFYPNNQFESYDETVLSLPVRNDTPVDAVVLNGHTTGGISDFEYSIDQLIKTQTNLSHVVLQVAWFASDLRAGVCEIRPRVENAEISGVVVPREWNVNGQVRSSADVLEVPQSETGRPLYSGTPSDDSVIAAIKMIKDKGLGVTLNPVLIMGMSEGNVLENPYSDNAATLGQNIVSTASNITCSPAAGFSGTVDLTAAASSQVSNFFTGSWGYNRMVTHYATLASAAGGVNCFLIGHKLSGLTTIRSSTGVYPAVSHLKTLAASVKAIVGVSTDVSYSASWSEYHSHKPEGTSDVYFNMDSLWSDTNIDFIGIDNAVPLTDWRDGSNHLDYDSALSVTSPHNFQYMQSNIEGGEYYDWVYSTEADRQAQVRTSVVDPLNKPWVFRLKDFRNWWLNPHYNRSGGVESGSSTDFIPSVKPIYFTHLGCPAVDRGSNQPDVVPNFRSPNAPLPHFSAGTPDEYLPRVYCEAQLNYWQDNAPVGMIDMDFVSVNFWDARPYPVYPGTEDLWIDTDDWTTGLSMTGRLAYPTLPSLVAQLCLDVGFTDFDVTKLNGAQSLVQGYYLDGLVSARDAIAALMPALQFDAFESSGKLNFVLKTATTVTPVSVDDMVLSGDEDGNEGGAASVTVVTAQRSELPRRISVDYIDAASDYAVASLDAKRYQAADSDETSSVNLPVSLSASYVRGLADSMLHQAWTGSDTGTLVLPPSYFKLDPGDAISFDFLGRPVVGRIETIEIGDARNISFRSFDPDVLLLPSYPADRISVRRQTASGHSELIAMDLPLLTGQEPNHWSPRLATYARPWPGPIAVYTDANDDLNNPNWQLAETLNAETSVGRLFEAVPAAKTDRWLRGQSITVSMLNGTLPSAVDELEVLNGKNVCAMQNDSGFWEVFQYTTATLDGSNRYTLTGLIRGQLGTEWVMNESAFSAGNTFVLIDNQLSSDAELAGHLSAFTSRDRDTTNRLRFGPATKDVGNDDVFLQTTFTHTARALFPHSPTDVKTYWRSDDIELRWKRRTRFNGDDWEVTEVPLSEDQEGYLLEILDGTNVVRSVNVTSPEFVYSQAQQVADFGVLQTSVHFRVYQSSASVGFGTPTEKEFIR